MEQIRSFIAIELPLSLREVLGRTIRELQAVAPGGIRWVRPEGIHLTLKFLGNIGADSVGPISKAMSRCTAPIAPFDLSLGGLGAFPNLSAPRVVWVGLEGALDVLSALQGAVEREMESLGFAREERPFSPHLTLGRAREGLPSPQRRRIGEALADASPVIKERTAVEEIALMQSTLTPSGAIYTQLFATPLRQRH